MSDPTSERIEGKTPAGGIASVAYFLDAKGNPCPKGKAASIEIHELDGGGEAIARTYGQSGRRSVTTPPIEQ